MISEKMNEKLNTQIHREFFSSYLYLSMEAYLTSLNLPGFAHFFRVQAQEERDHAMMFFNYVHKVGGTVKLEQIEAPKSDFASIKEVFTMALEHERFVTKSIYSIVELSNEEKDFATNNFLQWFINEQAEEEETADHNVKTFALIENDGRGILMMDEKLAARVYTPPTVAL